MKLRLGSRVVLAVTMAVGMLGAPGGTLLAAAPAVAVQAAAEQEAPQAGAATTAEEAARLVEAPEIPAWQLAVDAAMGRVNGWISAVFFFDLMFWDAEHTLPLVVLWGASEPMHRALRTTSPASRNWIRLGPSATDGDVAELVEALIVPDPPPRPHPTTPRGHVG